MVGWEETRLLISDDLLETFISGGERWEFLGESKEQGKPVKKKWQPSWFYKTYRCEAAQEARPGSTFLLGGTDRITWKVRQEQALCRPLVGSGSVGGDRHRPNV